MTYVGFTSYFIASNLKMEVTTIRFRPFHVHVRAICPSALYISLSLPSVSGMRSMMSPNL